MLYNGEEQLDLGGCIMKIIKRRGAAAIFDANKIAQAEKKAND